MPGSSRSFMAQTTKAITKAILTGQGQTFVDLQSQKEVVTIKEVANHDIDVRQGGKTGQTSWLTESNLSVTMIYPLMSVPFRWGAGSSLLYSDLSPSDRLRVWSIS